MTILLYIALTYLLITSGILYLNTQDFKPVQPTPQQYFDEQAPMVSVCIPARNEANSIARCVRSAVEQQYPNVEVIVLDDGSTDGTTDILADLSKEFSNTLTVLSGEPKPDDWLGKSWACQQLSQQAKGDILIFIDADTWLEPRATAKVVRSMGQDVVDFVTVWPMQKLGSFWERVVIPIIYFGLLTLLPSRYVYRPPKWIPSFIRQEVGVLFAAACGQFLAFKRSAYDGINGHQSVKNEVVEDVALAKNIKSAGYSMKMYHGAGTISCRMYESAEELWEGFRKNFFAGFDYNVPLFTGMALLQFITFILPALALPFLLVWGSLLQILLALLAVVIMFIQRFIVDQWFNWSTGYGLMHPLAIGWFEALGVRVLRDYFSDETARWKDRAV